MSKLNLMLVSLVAAIPGAALAVMLVMAFLNYGGGATVAFQGLAGLVLLLSAVVTLMPVGIFVMGPKSEKAARAAATGDDIEVVDEAEANAGDDIEELAEVEEVEGFGDDEVATADGIGDELAVVEEDFGAEDAGSEELLVAEDAVDDDDDFTATQDNWDDDFFDDDEAESPKKKKK